MTEKNKKSSKAYLDFIVPIKSTTAMGGGGRENATEMQKPNVDAEVYNNNKKCD